MPRICPYCEEPLTRHLRVCKKKSCRDKLRTDQLKRKREGFQKARRAKKQAKLDLNPIFCGHCGEKFTVDDDLRFPICGRSECRKWWKTERVERQKLRSAMAHVYREAPKPITDQAVQPGDFSQAVYEREQAELSKPNGYLCEFPKCKAPLKGNRRRWCDKHKRLMERKADLSRCDGNHIFENVSDGTEMWKMGVGA